MKYKKLNNFIIYLFVLFIFIFDVITPLGIASGTPYGLAVYLTLWSEKSKSTYYVSILLTALGYFLSSEVISPHYAIFINRILAVVIIIVFAVFVIHQRKRNKQIEELSAISTTDPLTYIGNRLAFDR